MAKGLAVGLQHGYVVSKIEVTSQVKKTKARKTVLTISQKESLPDQKGHC